MVARLKDLKFGSSQAQDPVLIVGSGPVGMRAARELLRREPAMPVVIYGDEPWENYDRVRLSSLLAGELSLDSLYHTLDGSTGSSLTQYKNTRIVKINSEKKLVIDQFGREQPYKALILAVGSSPRIPAIPGVGLPGIFTFRDLTDAQLLKARQQKSRHTVVIGGGLLGIETARAMQRENIEVTIIDHSPRLMSAQLDTEAADLLQEYVLSIGIRYFLGSPIREFAGSSSVERVILQNGKIIDCDTVVLATGIKPNTGLALDASIAIGHGVRVNDAMQTSVKDVYAIGDCAEHRGKVSGLVAPGFEQAIVAVNSVLGNRTRYKGSIAASRLKVLNIPVFSMGEVDERQTLSDESVLVYQQPGKDIYRKIVMKRFRIAGAIAVGEWSSQNRLQTLIAAKGIIWPWQKLRFLKTGELWPEDDNDSVVSWPNAAVICICTGVTRGQLGEAIKRGCKSVACLSEQSRASTVCGSCRPQLAQLLGANITQEVTPGRNLLLGLSLLSALLVAMLFTIKPLDMISTVVDGWHVSELWLDGIYKQISGYTLITLVVLSLVLSLSKRTKWFRFGSFNTWRFIHITLGILTLSVLLSHTGLRLGTNINKLLMMNFLIAAFIGSMAGGITALETNIGGALGKRLRRSWNKIHLYAAWPLPVLFVVHILSVYYF